MKCAYRIIPLLVTPSINPSDDIKVQLFITGDGNIHQKKLTYYCQKELLNDTNPVKLHSAIGTWNVDGQKSNSHEIELPYHVGWITVFKEYFKKDSESNDTDLSTIYGEVTLDKNAPYTFTFRTSQRARPGNYTINFVLTYSDGQEIDASHMNVDVHVRTWADRNAKFLQILGAVAGTIATITGIYFAI